MDIISPELIWIDGICFRINDSRELHKPEEYINDYEVNNDHFDDEDEEDLEFVKCDNGRIKTSFHVAQSFYGNIIGVKGAIKKCIENETRTEINIPARGQSGDIIVTGGDTKGVLKAVRRIKLKVKAARKKQRPTHFLSIPLNSEDIVESYKKLKVDILNISGSDVDDSIFTKPEKLHLTLLTMYLADETERQKMKNILLEVKKDIIRPHFENAGKYISINGVSYMNDDPRAVHVLYGAVDEKASNLSKLTEKIKDYLSPSGYLIGNRDNVKLHLTLMNTSNRKQDDDENSPSKKIQKNSFNASKILEKFNTYKFGDQKIETINLSMMSSTGPDGYYQNSAIIGV